MILIWFGILIFVFFSVIDGVAEMRNTKEELSSKEGIDT